MLIIPSRQLPLLLSSSARVLPHSEAVEHSSFPIPLFSSLFLLVEVVEHHFQQTEVAEGVDHHLEAVEGLGSLVVVEAVKKVVRQALGRANVSPS